MAGRYSSSLESKLAQDISRVDVILASGSPEYDWGVDISPKFIVENGSFNAGRSFVKAILCVFAYHRPLSFRDNGIVQISNYWLKQANSKNYHHFFPRAFLRKKKFEEWYANNVVNINIVDDYLNKREIGSKAPSKYMSDFSRDNSDIERTMRTHVINGIADFGIYEDDYDTFMQKRSEAISKELKKRLIKRRVDDLGQAQNSADLQEDEAA
ncbi:hypothetical protein [Paracoccus rhizosphaerae]|uniref:Uncharacterized protein n=1 Tax=Paracoccus rhizosphaerae TaxID=1133347 RepID=A0ABV6CKY9_9RHOB|nr:hypothetical protein [Paracoccus rhizosphaerae]